MIEYHTVSASVYLGWNPSPLNRDIFWIYWISRGAIHSDWDLISRNKKFCRIDRAESNAILGLYPVLLNAPTWKHIWTSMDIGEKFPIRFWSDLVPLRDWRICYLVVPLESVINGIVSSVQVLFKKVVPINHDAFWRYRAYCWCVHESWISIGKHAQRRRCAQAIANTVFGADPKLIVSIRYKDWCGGVSIGQVDISEIAIQLIPLIRRGIIELNCIEVNWIISIINLS